MKLGWRPSLEDAEVRKSFFDACFNSFDGRAGLAMSCKFNVVMPSRLNIDLGDGAADSEAAPTSTDHVCPDQKMRKNSNKPKIF